jgi:hypothetical protein
MGHSAGGLVASQDKTGELGNPHLPGKFAKGGGVMNRKLNWEAVTSAACLVLVCTAVVHAQGTAYGTDIKAAATNLYATMRGIGGVVMAIGLSMCGFKVFVQHDTEHLRSAMLVTAGGVLIMVAPSLVSALQSVTSGTTQTFQ